LGVLRDPVPFAFIQPGHRAVVGRCAAAAHQTLWIVALAA